MDEHQPILPPPLPLRVALWAMLNVLWFRLVRDVGRRAQRAVLAARHRWLGLAGEGVAPVPAVDHGAASIALLAREGRLTSLVGRLAEDRMARATVRVRTDRPTKVEVRRT